MSPPSTPRIGILAGSLRRDSISRALAQALTTMLPENHVADLIEIGEMPHYNPDLEGELEPASWKAFRAAIAGCDGVLFVTPEYNRSIPGVLKNAVDVGSRPRDAGSLNGRPAAVLSLSQGALGGVSANFALRQCLVTLGMPTLAQPEVFLGHAGRLLGSDGAFVDESARSFLSAFMSAFAEWTGQFRKI